MSEKTRVSRFIRIVNDLGKGIWGKRACAVWALCTAMAIALPAQTFTVLYDFCSEPGCLDGKHPSPALVQGTDGNLYGCGYSGGLYGGGNAFKLTPDGQMTIFYNFCSESQCADGKNPYGDFTLAPDGNFYGTTWFGGLKNAGVAFKLTPGGQMTTLYTFCSQSGCHDGTAPEGALLMDAEQNLYGTTWAGGAHGDHGTIFQLSRRPTEDPLQLLPPERMPGWLSAQPSPGPGQPLELLRNRALWGRQR
jgi:uncharacterized repeat protein (TIGR03803 family)